MCIEETTQQEGQPVVPTLYAVKLKIPEFGCHSAGVETWKPIFQVEFQQHKIPVIWSASQKINFKSDQELSKYQIEYRKIAKLP